MCIFHPRVLISLQADLSDWGVAATLVQDKQDYYDFPPSLEMDQRPRIFVAQVVHTQGWGDSQDFVGNADEILMLIYD